MTITITNNHNGEVYEMTPAKGAARECWKLLWSHAREIDRNDHLTGYAPSTDLLVAMFRSFSIGVN